MAGGGLRSLVPAARRAALGRYQQPNLWLRFRPELPSTLQIRRLAIVAEICKFDARTNRPIAQLTIYALALAHRTGLKLFDIKYTWFNENEYCELFPRKLFTARDAIDPTPMMRGERDDDETRRKCAILHSRFPRMHWNSIKPGKLQQVFVLSPLSFCGAVPSSAASLRIPRQ